MSKKQDKKERSGGDIIDEVDRRLNAKRHGVKKPRNLMLNVENWKQFEDLCKKADLWPSEVLDEFIAVYIERHRVSRTES